MARSSVAPRATARERSCRHRPVGGRELDDHREGAGRRGAASAPAAAPDRSTRPGRRAGAARPATRRPCRDRHSTAAGPGGGPADGGRASPSTMQGPSARTWSPLPRPDAPKPADGAAAATDRRLRPCRRGARRPRRRTRRVPGRGRTRAGPGPAGAPGRRRAPPCRIACGRRGTPLPCASAAGAGRA